MKMRNKIKVIKSIKILALGLGLLLMSQANSLTLKANSGKVAAKPIVIIPFAGNKENIKIDFVIAKDLKQSGIFSPVSPQKFRDRPTALSNVNFDKFRSLGVTYLVIGSKRVVNSKNQIKFSVIDVYQEQEVANHTISQPQQQLKKISHQVSDLILKDLTGISGSFAKQLVYIHEVGQRSNRRYSIMLSDVYGGETVSLITSKSPLMSPRFSPNANKIAYVTFEGKQAQIVTQDIKTGKRILVSKQEGLNSSPAWSPDGKKIAMVLTVNGNPEIYIKNLITGGLVRVTNNKAIDAEPSFSTNGQEIYFTSNRSGKPQLYRISLTTGSVTRLTRGSYSAGANVSKYSKVALATRKGSQYVIAVIDLKTGKYKAITNGFLDETPRFSPNGQMIIFSTVQNDKQVLKIANVDGSNEMTLSSNGHIRDADWSN